MGLIANIKNIMSSNQYESKIKKVTNLALTALTKPIGFITNTQKAYEKTSKQGATSLAIQGGLNAAAVVAPFSSAARSAATTAAKSVAKTIVQSAVKNPIPTTAAVLAGGPLVAGAISKNPSIVTELPSKAFETGKKLVETIQEHPTATALVGGLTGGVLAYEAGKALLGNNTDVNPVINVPSATDNTILPSMNNSNLTPNMPVTPATTGVVEAGSKSGIPKKSTKRRPRQKNYGVNNINIKIDDRDVYSTNRKVFKHKKTKLDHGRRR